MVPSAAPAIPNVNPNSLAPFVDPLPLPVIAVPTGQRSLPGSPGSRLPLYRVAARAVTQKLHRDLPATPLWAYGGSVPGVMFDVHAGEGVLIEWANELPAKHFLPIDHTLHGAEPVLNAGPLVHQDNRIPANAAKAFIDELM